MLANILFIIEDVRLYGQMAETISALVAERPEWKIRAALLQEYENRMEEWKMYFCDTVVVTDQAELIQTVQMRQGAMVAVLTEKNRGKSWEGVSFAMEGIANPGADYFQKVYDRCHGIPWTILETKRCLVREICLEDLDRLYEIYRDPSITQYMEGLYEDRKEEERYTQAYIRCMYGFYGYGMWIVEEKASGRIIGRAGLEHREDAEGVEIGYMIAREYQRQGYACEVCTAILNYARTELELPEIFCYTEAENEASRRLCQKLGFQKWEERDIKGKRYHIFKKIF